MEENNQNQTVQKNSKEIQNEIRKQKKLLRQQKRLENKAKPKTSWTTKWFWFKICFFVIAVLALIFVFFVEYRRLQKVEKSTNKEVVTSSIERAAELTVLKNNYTDVVCVKKTKFNGLAKSYAIIKYTGQIRAGVPSVKDIKIQFNELLETVHVIVPHAEILSNALISQEVFDEKQNIFVPISTQEIFDEIIAGQTETEINLVNSGFLNDVDLQTRGVIKEILIGCGYSNIRFSYVDDVSENVEIAEKNLENKSDDEAVSNDSQIQGQKKWAWRKAKVIIQDQMEEQSMSDDSTSEELMVE